MKRLICVLTILVLLAGCGSSKVAWEDYFNVTYEFNTDKNMREYTIENTSSKTLRDVKVVFKYAYGKKSWEVAYDLTSKVEPGETKIHTHGKDEYLKAAKAVGLSDIPPLGFQKCDFERIVFSTN